jgi:hypothetical protein
MSKFHFRIGAKLTLSALIGVILVLAMVGNQARVNALSRHLAHTMDLGEALKKTAERAETALRQLILTDREIRLATTQNGIKSILEDIEQHIDNGNKSYDLALATATEAGDRTEFGLAKEAFNEYAGTAKELGAAQRIIIALREHQIEQGLEWSRKLEVLFNSSSVVADESRMAFIRTVRSADSVFQQARLESWSRFTRSDEGQMARLYVHLDDAVILLRMARQMVSDTTLVLLIDPLLASIPRYRAAVDQLTVAMEQQAVLLRSHADPWRETAGGSPRAGTENAGPAHRRAASFGQF